MWALRALNMIFRIYHQGCLLTALGVGFWVISIMDFPIGIRATHGHSPVKFQGYKPGAFVDPERNASNNIAGKDMEQKVRCLNQSFSSTKFSAIYSKGLEPGYLFDSTGRGTSFWSTNENFVELKLLHFATLITG